MNIFASHGFVSISNYTDEPLNDEEKMRIVREYEKNIYTYIQVLHLRGVKFWEKLFLVVNFFRLYVVPFFFFYLFIFVFFFCLLFYTSPIGNFSTLSESIYREEIYQVQFHSPVKKNLNKKTYHVFKKKKLIIIN